MTPARRFIIGRALAWAAVIALCVAVPMMIAGLSLSIAGMVAAAIRLLAASILFFLCGYLLLGEDGR